MCSSRSALTRYVIKADRCARSRSSSGVERQCDGQLTPVSMRPHAQRNRGSLNVTGPNASRRVVLIIFHPANPMAAGADRPPDRVLPSPARRRSCAEPARAAVSFRERQSQIGDIAEVIRLADLHDVHCKRPSSPAAANFKIHSTPPPPVQEQERKYPARTGTPSFAPVPQLHRPIFFRILKPSRLCMLSLMVASHDRSSSS